MKRNELNEKDAFGVYQLTNSIDNHKVFFNQKEFIPALKLKEDSIMNFSPIQVTNNLASDQDTNKQTSEQK